MNTRLTRLLHIEHPIIMAPMFLVSNVNMAKAAAENGIACCIPALNYRNEQEFERALVELNKMGKCYGINLIVNRSNIRLRKQLQLCVEYKVPFIITSLGKPEEVIRQCKPIGIKVFCDVSDMKYARKVAGYNPDGLIAVTNQAGGHLGSLSPGEFIPALVSLFPDLIIISAGGVGDHVGLMEKIHLGADGVSVGSIFIASVESPVSEEYKKACIQYGAKDIVCTTKLSGLPCTVINTPYVQKIGTRQNWFQSLINRNKRFKKWFKMLTYMRGMKVLRKAAFDATYQNVWCAGISIEHVHSIRPVKEIIKQLIA